MLVNKRQEWDVYQEVPDKKEIAKAPRLNVALRAKCLTLVLLIACMAMFVTVRSENIISAGYDLVKNKTQVAKVEKENELLRLEIARLKSPERIQTIATSKLGMVLPQQVYCAESTAKQLDNPAGNENKTMANKVVDLLKVSKAEANKAR